MPSETAKASLGYVTSYGAARRGGYQGTYEEWCALMAEVADHLEENIQLNEDSQAAKAAAETAELEAEAAALTAESWAKGTKGGTDVPSTDPAYHDNAKYYAGEAEDQKDLAEQAASAAAGSAETAEGHSTDAEAWAAGTRGGEDVESGDDAYHNNAKYYSEQSSGFADDAAGSASDAESWAKGTKNGTDVPSTDPTYHNNAKYWSEQAEETAEDIEASSAQIAQNASDIGDLKTQFLQYSGTKNSLNINEYEKGSITTTTGENSTYRQNARARTIKKTTAVFDFTISVYNDAGTNTNFYVEPVIYDGSSITDPGAVHEGESYTIRKGQVYRLLIGDTTRDSSSSTIDLNELISHVIYKSAIGNAYPDASESDVGKVVKVKTVENGIVIEYEYDNCESVAVDATLSISGDAADAKATGDFINSVIDGEIASKNGVDFWGKNGSKNLTGLSVSQKGTIITIDGTYTTSARMRFNLSGNLENNASLQTAWYSTAKAPLYSGRNYKVTVKEIGGNITFPEGNTNPAYNLQTYSTSGATGINAYKYADRISAAIVTSDGTPLGAIILTINQDFAFDNYSIYIGLEEVDASDSVVYIDGTNGNDTNTGLKIAPLKTISRALTSGFRKLRVTPGVYNDKISISDGALEILKWEDSESYSEQFRKKIEFINGTRLTVSASGTENIYQAAFTAASDSNIYKVFVSRTAAPTTQGSLSLEYNAMLIGDKPNNTGGNNKQRLYTPVLTEEELSGQGTFWYNGSNLIKFHPWNNTLDDAYYIPNDDAGTIIDLTGMDSVYIEDVRIVGAYDNCAYIKKCVNVRMTACEFGLCGKGMGLRLDNSNAVIADCHAFGCAVDGFNLHEYGHSEFYGCTGFYCGDDGISHHQGCTGTIDGGEWAYNGFGSGNGAGIAPTFGSQIETRNVYSHNNHLGIMQEGTSGHRRTIRWSNNVVVDNDKDFYIQYYDVIAWNCVYKTKNVQAYGTLTEFNNTILT